jgi:hypothetical protein
MTVAQLKAILADVPDSATVELEYDTLCCSGVAEVKSITIYDDSIVLSEEVVKSE